MPLPDPLTLVLEDAARGLTTNTRMRVGDELLETARRALDGGTQQEQAEAVLLLAFSSDEKDRARLIELAGKPDDPLSDRALVALGLRGEPSADLYLTSVLKEKKESTKRRAFAALGLGLETPIGEPAANRASMLVAHAQVLLERSTERHAPELAACFFGIPVAGGGALFKNYLRTSGGSISLEKGREAQGMA
ncbi:MAG: hypothetical protein R3F30_16315, partial [Planctomycetota bacterium]